MFKRMDTGSTNGDAFSEEVYQEELKWLSRKKYGLIEEIITPTSLLTVLSTAAIIALVFGVIPGIFVTTITGGFGTLIVLPVIILVIAFKFLNRPFATFKIDLEEPLIEYTGVMMFAGDAKSAKYRGPFQVIEGTELLKEGKKFYLRFITNSGYMRIPYEPEVNSKIYDRLNELGVINLSEVNTCMDGEPIEHKKPYDILYRINFDRTEFKKELAIKREKERKEMEFEKAERRRKLIEKSKERKSRVGQKMKKDPLDEK